MDGTSTASLEQRLNPQENELLFQTNIGDQVAHLEIDIIIDT